MCAAAAKTGRHMVADTPSSNTLSIIKRKEFQEDPYAGQSRYKNKLKRPSVFFCSIATVDIPAGVNPSTKCMAAGQMADTIRTHGRFFFLRPFLPRDAAGRLRLGEPTWESGVRR